MRIIWLTCVLGLVVACETGDPVDPQGDGGVGQDSDGDGILDEHENAAFDGDADGDGIPDYRDLDSDGDGIPDSVEAGDEDLSTPPIDSDGDGTPDFLDLDSDDNGLPDADEVHTDTDGDGLLNYVDPDDDADGAPDVDEIRGIIDPLLDTDGDGMPNHRDPDSDNDTILDGDERGRDTDGDGLEDWYDLDSDNDGIPDSVEAGDDDIRSPPRNSDAHTGDLVPDYLDPDSDNDGLLDRLEVELGTSPVSEDTDSDGVSDLIEFAAGTDPLNPGENPRTRGDFVFVVPHEEAPNPTRDTLEFRTNVQFADIYFLFDSSGTMSDELSALQGAVTTLINDLTCLDTRTPCTDDASCGPGQVCGVFTGTCVEDPGVSSCLLSPWTGGGRYVEDFQNLLSVQPSVAATASALSFSTGSGVAEHLYDAAWAIADPVGSMHAVTGCDPPTPGRIGCVGFREDAVRILVAFTDEGNCGDGTSGCSLEETAAQLVGAADALRNANINVIGIWSDTPTDSERQDLVDLVTAAGSLDRRGDPLVFDGRDSGVVPAVTTAINEIVQGVPLRATIVATDEPDDDGDALQFIDYLEVNTDGGRCSAIAAVEDTDGDGHADAFPAVLPGTPICWDVVPRRNDAVEPTEVPQVFRARLTVSGDGSPLDARRIFFLVPPQIEGPIIE